MRPNVKARMVYLLYAVLAMQRSGERRDIYRIVYEPQDGVRHSSEYEVYANPEFCEEIE